MSQWDDLTCPRCGSKNVTAHMVPVDATGEAELWVPVRDEGFLCGDCKLMEYCLTSAREKYPAFNKRWNRIDEPFDEKAHLEWMRQRDREEEEEARAWTWPHEEEIHDRAWRTTRLWQRRADDEFTFFGTVNGERVVAEVPALPINEQLQAEIIANPDDAAPRWKLVEWLRTVDHLLVPEAVEFIEGQLRLADALAKDPCSDFKETLPIGAFSPRDDKTCLPWFPWWRYQSLDGFSMYEFTRILSEVGLIDDVRSFRGFDEHVAVKAVRFLEIADELYSLAPIRQLTITYCKGQRHDDVGLLKALLQSPHLARIRGLRLPVRYFGRDKGEVTQLNRLTDDDIALLADSAHLHGLRYLDLEDQQRLSIRAFDALASSTKLPELSAVFHDLNHYYSPGTFSFGRSGGEKRSLNTRPLQNYRAELEARHGYLPWLHVEEHYGSETPDVEAVIERPVALASTPRG